MPLDYLVDLVGQGYLEDLEDLNPLVPLVVLVY
jgi:hypothetical protein